MNIGDLIRNAMNQTDPVVEKPKELTLGDLIKIHCQDEPVFMNNDFDDEFYEMVYRSDEITVIDGIEYYETCNYKGEGEGYVLKDEKTSTYPVFISKSHSMM